MGQCILMNNSGGGMNATLLWENPNPNNSIGDFSVTINNMLEFDYLLVTTKETTTSKYVYQSLIEIRTDRVFGAKPSRILLQPISSIWTNDTNSIVYGTRQVEFNNDTKLLLITKNWDCGKDYEHSDRNIPLEIYGIKGKINGVK